MNANISSKTQSHAAPLTFIERYIMQCYLVIRDVNPEVNIPEGSASNFAYETITSIDDKIWRGGGLIGGGSHDDLELRPFELINSTHLWSTTRFPPEVSIINCEVVLMRWLFPRGQN
jgi:hypothetical protein